MVKFFVSPTGSNSNDGLSATTAKATVQAAAALIVSGRGDEVEVLPGSYPNQPTVNITGKNSFKIYGSVPNYLQGIPTLEFDSDFSATNGLKITSCYNYTISYLRIHGEAATLDKSTAIAFQEANPNTFSAKYDMNGVEVRDSYNFILRGLLVQDFPGGGISCIDCDQLQLDSCIVRRCTNYSKYGTQGISILCSFNSPGAVAGATRMRITNCTSYDNVNYVKWLTGNGLLNEGYNYYFDTTKRKTTEASGTFSYTGKALIDSCVGNAAGAGAFQALNAADVTMRNCRFDSNRQNLNPQEGVLVFNNSLFTATANIVSTFAGRKYLSAFNTSNASTSSFSNNIVVGTTAFDGASVTQTGNTFVTV